MRVTEDNINAVSAVVYTVGAALAATVFFGVAIVSDYGWVARLGGAGWVFLLSMVILMPTVPSLVRGRSRADGEPTHEGHDAMTKAEATGPVKDPVCGMEIDPASAAGSSEYRGQTHYFCNLNCKQSFDAEPEKYASS